MVCSTLPCGWSPGSVPTVTAAGMLGAALADAVGDVRTRATDRLAYAHDASHFVLTPQAVVVPRDAAEVGRLFATARRAGVPLTFRSGGTSLSGQAVTGGILADTRRHFRRVEVVDDGARVRVGPGATIRQVNARLAAYGRKLGPDPASEGACTLGGVVANNSSGMACGTVANSYATLESLTLVLPSGTVVDTGAPDADARLRGPGARAARGPRPDPRPAPRRRHVARQDRAAVLDEEHDGLRAQLVPRPHPSGRRAGAPRGGQRGHARVHRRDRHAHGAAAAPRPHRPARVRRLVRSHRCTARARRHRPGHHRAARRHLAARRPDRPAGRRPPARAFRGPTGRAARRVPGRDRRRRRHARRGGPRGARGPAGHRAAHAGRRPRRTGRAVAHPQGPLRRGRGRPPVRHDGVAGGHRRAGPGAAAHLRAAHRAVRPARLRGRRDLRARQGRQHPLHAHRAAVRRLARPVLPVHRGHGRSSSSTRAAR